MTLPATPHAHNTFRWTQFRRSDKHLKSLIFLRKGGRVAEGARLERGWKAVVDIEMIALFRAR